MKTIQKECQIVLLEVKRQHYKSGLYRDVNGKLHLHNVTNGGQQMDMYILSDDKVKEGDWVIFANKPVLLTKEDIHPTMQERQRGKIIATTNPELIVNNCFNKEVQGIEMTASHNKRLPIISNKSLQEYVKNPVDKILVEYEAFESSGRGSFERNMLNQAGSPYPKEPNPNWYNWRPIVSNDNIILISFTEISWNNIWEEYLSDSNYGGTTKHLWSFLNDKYNPPTKK